MNNEFKDKKVLVLGLARSGMAAIKVLHKLGAKVYLSEKKQPSQQEKDMLDSINVEIMNQDMSIFEKKYDLIVKNPGVSPTGEIVKQLQKRNIPIITEIELAFKVCKPQHYIAITGTNGKTTTTTLIYEMLKTAFKNKALVGGNIGTPLCELLLEYNLMEKEGYYISLEISNHQLVDIDTFRPQISTIINLTPDHLETMGSLDNYYKSKTKIYQNMKDNDIFIYNQDDKNVIEYSKKYPINCKTYSFSLDRKDTYAHISENYIVVDTEKIVPLSSIKLVGKHNLQNIIVSVIVAKALGISNIDINNTIENFNGVEHRIEFVKEINGVKYYNDSKGTNTDATITAIKSFNSNIILLVGGYEKGLSMKEMKKYMSSVKKVIGFGAAGKRIANDLVNNPIVVVTLDEAVAKAKEIAIEGDIVLLSPTTSSFDQYKNYEERGKHFKELINKL